MEQENKSIDETLNNKPNGMIINRMNEIKTIETSDEEERKLKLLLYTMIEDGNLSIRQLKRVYNLLRGIKSVA